MIFKKLRIKCHISSGDKSNALILPLHCGGGGCRCPWTWRNARFPRNKEHNRNWEGFMVVRNEKVMTLDEQ